LKKVLEDAEHRGRVMEKRSVQVSRACAVLYADILGDWRKWKPVTRIKHPERVEALIDRIKKTLFRAVL